MIAELQFDGFSLTLDENLKWDSDSDSEEAKDAVEKAEALAQIPEYACQGPSYGQPGFAQANKIGELLGAEVRIQEVDESDREDLVY